MTIPFSCTVNAAFAADVTGKWTFEQQGRGGNPTTVTLNLKAEGSSVSGMLSQPGRNGVTESKITDGKIEGNNLSSKSAVKMGDNTITTEYMGTVNGDRISLKKITSLGCGDGAAPVVREATAKRATT